MAARPHRRRGLIGGADPIGGAGLLFNHLTHTARSPARSAPYAGAVDMNHLSPRQAAALAEKLAPMLGYLVRLTDRMQKRGWDPDDFAYRSAWRARDELHGLCVRLRYQAVGNPGTPPPRPWERREGR